MTQQAHRERRRRLMEQLPEGIILVPGRGTGGVNPSFLYLTGIEEPGATLLLAAGGIRIGTGRQFPGPDYVRGRSAHQVLLLPATDALAARWGEDSAMTADSVRPASVGVDAVLGAGALNDLLASALPSARQLHLVRAAPPTLAEATDPDAELAARLRSRFLNLELRDASAVVHEMRRRKDDAEVAAVTQAIEVTARALDAAVGRIRAGVREHEIEAEIARVYRSHGGVHAFDPIVAGGANALKLHYDKNSGTIERGELLLVDTGVSIDGYKSDITRTFPVDGRFTDRQREVYAVVLRAQREAIARCRPGALLGDIHAHAYQVIADAGFGEHFIHGVGHHLGLETHDVGDVHRPLEPGAILTVEPGIYIADEQIGIRLEDDVLVSQHEPQVLSSAIPIEPQAVERWMQDGKR